MAAASAPATGGMQIPDWFAADMKELRSPWHPTPAAFLRRISPWMSGRGAQGTAMRILVEIFLETVCNLQDGYPQWSRLRTTDQWGYDLDVSRGTARDALAFIKAHELTERKEVGTSFRHRLLFAAIAKLNHPRDEPAKKERDDEPFKEGQQPAANGIPNGKKRRSTFTLSDGTEVIITWTNNLGIDAACPSITRRHGHTYDGVLAPSPTIAAEEPDQLLQVIEPLFIEINAKPIDAKHRAAIAAPLNGTPPQFFLRTLLAKYKSGKKLPSGLWPAIAGDAAAAWKKMSDRQRAPYLAAASPALPSGYVAGAPVEDISRANDTPLTPSEDEHLSKQLRFALQGRMEKKKYTQAFYYSKFVRIDDSILWMWTPNDETRGVIEREHIPLLAKIAGVKAVSFLQEKR
jgi:hypothetical protein